MLKLVRAQRFEKAQQTGRTRPCVATCIDDTGAQIELILKYSAGCEAREKGLLREALAAMLAVDLGLPVPEPFLVEVDPDFAASIPDEEIKNLALESVGLNFGSRKLPPGFSTVPVGLRLSPVALTLAAEILAFDTLIQNPDRTLANPNLLVRENEMAIIDHELAFFMDGIIGWRPPWEPGSIVFTSNPDEARRHVFFQQLRGKPVDFERLETALCEIPRERFELYRAAIPHDWTGDGTAIDKIIAYLLEVQTHHAAFFTELIGALR